LHSGGWSPYWVHSSRRPLLAYCTCHGWLWCWWRIWWNEDWQGKPKYSEKTCPSATLFTTNLTCQTRARTRPTEVGSQRITAWAMARPKLTVAQLLKRFAGFLRADISWPRLQNGFSPYRATLFFKVTFNMGSRDSSVDIATGYELDNPGSISGSARFFSSSQRRNLLWGPPSLLCIGHREYSGRGVKPTTRLRVVSRSRKVELYFRFLIRLHGIVLN
jgi:hypothetical protein